MTDFQVGDKVQYTGIAGTVITGEIRYFTDDYGFSADSFLLYHRNYPERTALLERPSPKVPTEHLSVVQHKDNGIIYKLVRIDETDTPWLGFTGDAETHWFTDSEVQDLLDSGNWEVTK